MEHKNCRRCEEKHNLIVVGKLFDYLNGSPKCDRPECDCREGYWVCKTCLGILNNEFENGR